MLAGHIDTVPVADNLPSRLGRGLLYGCGSCDMKSGVAVQLRLAAAALPEPRSDVTYVFYDGEEVEAERNGLLRLPGTPRTCWTATSPCCSSRPARHRGRLPGHDAGRDPRDRPARAQRPVLERH